MGQGVADRAAQKLLLPALLGAEEIDHDTPLSVPVQDTRIVERMEHPESYVPPQNRHSYAAEALAQFVKEPCGRGIEQRLSGQPLDDGAAKDRRCRHFSVHARRSYRRIGACARGGLSIKPRRVAKELEYWGRQEEGPPHSPRPLPAAPHAPSHEIYAM